MQPTEVKVGSPRWGAFRSAESSLAKGDEVGDVDVVDVDVDGKFEK